MKVKLVSACLVCVLWVACGFNENRSLQVATPSFSANNILVPLGSPIEATFRFDVKETLPALKQDYRVFVHILDANEELLWTEDHYPLVPTSKWSPGETVEYERTIFVPIYPYVGKAIVRLGLYSELDGSRLPLDGDHVGLNEYQVATLQLLPQSENISLVPKRGWHGLERAAADASVEWRWTKKRAILSFQNPKRDLLLYLDLEGHPKLFEAPQIVTLSIENKTLAALELAESGRVLHRIPLSVGDLGDTETIDLQIAVDKTFTPASLDKGTSFDSRELGVRVFKVAVQQQ